jgi:hypothetical protein
MVIGTPGVYHSKKQGQCGEQEHYFLDRVFGVAKHFNLSEKTDSDLSPVKTEIPNSKHQITNKFQYPNLKKDQTPIAWNFEFRSL